VPGTIAGFSPRYRRRIEQQQPRDTEQANAELQQLREQVQTLTRERDRYQSSLRDHYRDGQQAAAEALQTWLRPVLELVALNPDDCSPLAVSVLRYLPGIASRLIEE
jgi:flagellar biosynthesis/type III secretory pathway protein FliH